MIFFGYHLKSSVDSYTCRQVNYKEPSARETYVKDAPPAKRAKRTSTTGAAATATVKSKTRDKASSKPAGKTSKAKGKAKAKARTETQAQTQSQPQPPPVAAASSANRKKARDDVLEERNDGGEKRKKSWQHEPSEKFLGNMDRALVQPLLFIDRQRCDTLEAPCETFTIAGNSGKDCMSHRNPPLLPCPSSSVITMICFMASQCQYLLETTLSLTFNRHREHPPRPILLMHGLCHPTHPLQTHHLHHGQGPQSLGSIDAALPARAHLGRTAGPIRQGAPGAAGRHHRRRARGSQAQTRRWRGVSHLLHGV